MGMEKVYVRNPYPLPDLVREGEWTRKPVLGEKVIPQDKGWTANLKSHERLFAHHTLNSIRKDTRLVRLKVPNDSLDLTLTTIYVHNKDTLVPKVYVPMQPESLGTQTWRVLKNRIEIYKTPTFLGDDDGKDDAVSKLLTHCHRGPLPERRVHPSSVKLNITGQHSVQSNPGYSRKIDGTFYSI